MCACVCAYARVHTYLYMYGHRAEWYLVATTFTSCGRFIVSAGTVMPGNRSHISVVNAQYGSLEFTHLGDIYLECLSLSLSPAGRLAVPCRNSGIMLFDVTQSQADDSPVTIRPVGSIDCHHSCAVTFSPSGNELVSGTSNNEIIFWNMDGEIERKCVLRGHDGKDACGCALHPCGSVDHHTTATARETRETFRQYIGTPAEVCEHACVHVCMHACTLVIVLLHCWFMPVLSPMTFSNFFFRTGAHA